jgi:hypothetical protein
MSDDLNIIERVYERAFYRCRNGAIVGPIVDDGREPSFGYVAALGKGEWDVYGWARNGKRAHDLVEEIKPPLTWTGAEWRLKL